MLKIENSASVFNYKITLYYDFLLQVSTPIPPLFSSRETQHKHAFIIPTEKINIILEGNCGNCVSIKIIVKLEMKMFLTIFWHSKRGGEWVNVFSMFWNSYTKKTVLKEEETVNDTLNANKF